MKPNPFQKLYQKLFKHKTPEELKQEITKEIKDALPVVKDRLQQAGEIVNDGVRKVIPLRDDNPETRYFKILGLSFVALMGIGVLAGLASFLLTLRSPESVAVPQTIGQDLITAIDNIQEFGLVPRIEQQSSPDQSTKGKVLSQNPAAGTTVRVGREVTLVISRGNNGEKLSNYVGRNIDEVRQEIRTQFIGDKPVVQVADVAYSFDDSEPGIIIAQEPESGIDLNGSIQLKLLVSRGKDAAALVAPALLGAHWDKAAADIMASGIPFNFKMAPANGGGSPGTVVIQDPAPAESLPAGGRVTITIAAPETSGHQVFGLYETTLPEYASGVDISVSSLSGSGIATVLYQFKHIGGKLSFPYVVDENTELIVTAFGKEIDRRTIKK